MTVSRPAVLLDGETGCWLWLNSDSGKGYGHLMVAKKRWQAHRYFYTLLRGPIPAGLQIDHLCRNRRCVNPDHMEAVTPKENTKRGYGTAGQNGRKTHCKHGHPFTPENTRATRGARQCWTCRRIARQAYKLSKRSSP